MLVKNPTTCSENLNNFLSDNISKLLWLCLDNTNILTTRKPFVKRIISAATEIQKDLKKSATTFTKYYTHFLFHITKHNLYYNIEDHQFWRDLHQYVVGEKSLKVIDSYQDKIYYLPGDPPPQKEIIMWRDIRKLRF